MQSTVFIEKPEGFLDSVHFGTNARHEGAAQIGRRLFDLTFLAYGLPDVETRREVLRSYEFLMQLSLAASDKLLWDPFTFSIIIEMERAAQRQEFAIDRTLAEWIASGLSLLCFGAALQTHRAHEGFAFVSDGELTLPGAIELAVSAGRQKLFIRVAEDGVVTANGQKIDALGPIEFNDFSVLDSAFLFKHRLPENISVLSATKIKASRTIENLRKALALTMLEPASNSLVRNLVRYIYFAATLDCVEGRLSASFRSLPGLIVLEPFGDSVDIAEDLVHEADHQRYYILSRSRKIWKSDAEHRPVFRSPWRPDPRPLDGLLAGASAFMTVARFYSRLATSKDASIKSDDRFAPRAIRARAEALDAIATIRRYGGYTSHGYNLIVGLESMAAEVDQRLGQFADHASWSIDAKSVLTNRQNQWRRHFRSTEDRLIGS